MSSEAPTLGGRAARRDVHRHGFVAGEPPAAICHGPWTLIDAGVVKRLRPSLYNSIEADLQDAGGRVE